MIIGLEDGKLEIHKLQCYGKLDFEILKNQFRKAGHTIHQEETWFVPDNEVWWRGTETYWTAYAVREIEP